MEVLKNLSANEVRALRERFREPLPVDEFEEVLEEFVRKMPHIDIAKLRLQELFNDIDANGDSTVSWDEFTMFIIDAAALEATLTTSGRDAVIKQYRPAATLDDEVPGSVTQIRYIKDINRVVKVVDRDKYSKIRLCMPEATLPVSMELSRTDAMVVTIEYIPAKASISTSNVLCTSMNDNVIRYYDMSRHVLSTSTVIKCRKSMPVPETQTALQWDLEHAKLMMGSRSGVVSVVNPDETTPINTERIHNSVISRLLCSNGVLYSASLDSSIKLIDLNRGVVKHTIEGPHSHLQGVFNLGISEANQLLFSVGLEPNVFVHSLSNAKMKPQKLVDKNRPHHGRIVGLEVLRDSPQIISADTSGLVKIWDARSLGCVQTISTVKDDVFNISSGGGSVLSAVGYVEKNKHLVICGRTTKVFAYDTASKPHLSDDGACSIVVFNPVARVFLTVHGTTVKTWDGQTGALRGVHTHITDSDITAVCLVVPRMRKFVAGTYKGDLFAFGFAMCSPMGDFPQAYEGASASVVALAYLDGFKENRNPYILTVFKREVVLVPDAEEHVQRSALNLHCFEAVLKDDQAKTLAVTENKTVLVGTEGAKIYVCDLASFSLSCVVQPAGLVGDIACLSVFPEIGTPFMSAGREGAGHLSLNNTFVNVASAAQFNTSMERSFSSFGGGGGPAISATANTSTSALPYYRRLGTGIAFVADSTGSISAVLMHSAIAMETLVTWKNLQSGHRRRRKRQNPNASSSGGQDDTDDDQGGVGDDDDHLYGNQSLHLGEVVNMAEALGDDDGEDGEVSAPALPIDLVMSGSPRTKRGKRNIAFTDDALESTVAGSSTGGGGGSTSGAGESNAAVQNILGSRPNSAVAAYFRAPHSRTDLAPVVTAMAFLPDGHILVTGDENGYLTTWDVDLIVRKAARQAAKVDSDVWSSVAPSPIASWKAHLDEVVSIAEVFGDVPKHISKGSSEPRTGAVLASASVDRNVVLWTTDGVSLGNLAQGRIPASNNAVEDNVVMPDGIAVYRLDDPPADAWSLTDKVRIRRDVVAAMSEPPHHRRHTGVPTLPLSRTMSIGFGALSQHAKSAFADRAAHARQLVGNRNQASEAQPAPSAPATGSAFGHHGAGAGAGGGGSRLNTAGSATSSPLVNAALLPPAPPITTNTRGTSFFVTELDEPTASISAEGREYTDMLENEDSRRDPARFVPKELRGLVNSERFKLPLIPKPRRGRRALAESASPRSAPPAVQTPRVNAQTTRQEAIALVERGSVTQRSNSLGADINTLLVPQPPKENSNSNSLGKHLSVATQKYLHSLGFDDNPAENAEQKFLRHHGRAVLSRVATKAEVEPSRRIV